MNVWQIIVTITVALLGYPIGLIIAKLADDELLQGKKWFKLIVSVCILAIVVSIIVVEETETLLFFIASFIFITLVALASLVKAQKIGNKRKKDKKDKK
ncbi:MAG: hypothetical protein N3G19_00400 [Candidatus Pacearchaeota archaeon]|nr:hypothetical protein [Candidatus Pacearchaeota archaeon]